jgi:hypothetical protein
MSEEITTNVEQLRTYITQARQAVANRRYMDISGLLGEVETMCQNILALPKDQGQFFIEALDELQENLRMLQLEMRDAQGDLSRESAQLSANQKAARSYRASQETAPKLAAEE